MPFTSTPDYTNTDAGGACFFCRAAQREEAGVKELLFRADQSWDEPVPLCVDGHPVNDLDRGTGNIVICASCVSELAAQIGWASPADVQRHIADVDDLRARVAAHEEFAAKSAALVSAAASVLAAERVADVVPNRQPEPAPEPAPAADKPAADKPDEETSTLAVGLRADVDVKPAKKTRKPKAKAAE